MDRPSISEVLAYAKPQIGKFLSKFDLPREIREEIEQDAYERLLVLYDSIDPEAGWKSFVYNHCRGAVLDYIKLGKGFQEDKWSKAKEEEDGSPNIGKMRERVFLHTDSGDELSIDQVLGNYGVFSEIDLDKINIRWDLVARMASVDQGIHAFAKLIRGIPLEQIGPSIGLCRARAGQLIQEFVDKFDDPKMAENPWFLQTCYAFGLCKSLGIRDVDQSFVFGYKIGHNFEPVDLDEILDESVLTNEEQMSFFDESV